MAPASRRASGKGRCAAAAVCRAAIASRSGKRVVPAGCDCAPGRRRRRDDCRPARPERRQQRRRDVPTWLEAATDLEWLLVDNHQSFLRYHNPIDNVTDLAHHFFARCLVADGGEGVVPYVVVSRTRPGHVRDMPHRQGRGAVRGHQEDRLQVAGGLLGRDEGGLRRTLQGQVPRQGPPRDRRRRARPRPRLLGRAMSSPPLTPPSSPGPSAGELPHLISDAATMQIIRWTGGERRAETGRE